MARGFSLKLPLAKDASDGLKLNKTIKEGIKQNLKMLILTSQGERIMVPDYGVGIYELLFDQNYETLPGRIRERISQQVLRYLPYIEIVDIGINHDTTDKSVFHIRLEYFVSSIGITDDLVITAEV